MTWGGTGAARHPSWLPRSSVPASPTRRQAVTSWLTSPAEAAAAAVRQLEVSRGTRLSERQCEVAKALMTSGHSLDLVLGVAGSGKTTTLAAVRAGFEESGYALLGAATSGQAAMALGEGTGVSSSTVASLTWRLDHKRVALSPAMSWSSTRRP
jgi:ATP-dependent exoDNAse (exonuclease V) alpha subunit